MFNAKKLAHNFTSDIFTVYVKVKSMIVDVLGGV